MSVFRKPYAALYDLLYREKDYPAECDFLERLFVRHARRQVRSLLDLGCGTGGHALLFAGRGLRVAGVDRSPTMLRIARAKARAGPGPGRVKFFPGDVRAVRLGRRFDAVVALFAVMGYQIADADFVASVRTAAVHLVPGGLFAFDVWYGPAVLASPPGAREKTVRDGARLVRRRTDCEVDALAQVVQVRFGTTVREGRRTISRGEETHPMRFFFPRELGLLVRAAGLEPTAIVPFLDDAGTPGADTWNVTVVATRPYVASRGRRPTQTR